MRSRGGSLRALVVIAVAGAPALLAPTAHAASTPISIPQVTTPPVSTPIVTIPSVDVTVPVTVTVPEVDVTVPTVTVPTTVPQVQEPARPATITAVTPPPAATPASRDRSAPDVPRAGTENAERVAGPAPDPAVRAAPTLAAAARHATVPFAVPLGAMLLIAAYVVLRGVLDRRDLRLASASTEDPWVGFR